MRTFFGGRAARWAVAGLLTLSAAACGGGGGSKNATTGGTGGNGGTPAPSAATPASLAYVSSEPRTIYLAGTPGTARSSVTFRLLDALGAPVAGRSVTLRLLDTTSGAALQNARPDGSVVLTTDAEGLVTVGVLSGTVPGAIRLTASVTELPLIAATSQELTVAVGRPAQRGLSLAPARLSVEGFNVDGTEVALTLALADRNGNPVPDGTQVNFVAEAGVLTPASCVVTGGASRCSVTLRSQGVRPDGGRVSILAYTPGEEDFTDLNGNNRYDAGEPFTDLGQAYRDDNESDDGSYVPVHDPGEFFLPRPGAVACAGGDSGRANTCDGTWGEADVRARAVVIFATSTARFSALSGGVVVVSDANGNSMPFGSGISASVRVPSGSNSPCAAEISPTTIPNRTTPQPVSVRFTDCAAGDELVLTVKAPSGVETVGVFPAN